ncbi:GAF and ANTAR domain-containing protein [Pseudarthrobacter sp. NIBRBAC000502772]|uniref:GAF and ANTAR domain-containing protein n=1 Tax=Pseudarthrobacter sp. NIBRBAC000502772 TaxID=2590775 RepID=UPI0011329B89|nr:GAF and ANTAR domain-containing protein [Pseudarthrobacter sp. NIBRBAC000502772]QDG65354.1 GAF and ANTAR domain-containing protein [Pseudarthrobacter sp. NIBRBAC000502772]
MTKKYPLDELSTALGRIMGLLLTEEKVDHAVQHLSRAVRDSIPGTVGAGVSILDPHARPVSSGFTGSVVERADALQYELVQGPCLTAWATQESILIHDVAAEARWPNWSAAVVDFPIRSVISTPLIADGQAIGAMKIYAATPGAFEDATAALMELFASPAATLLSHIQTAETPERISAGLQSALFSRDLINRACGILMERHTIAEDAALQQLMRQARATRSTLKEVSTIVLAGVASHPRRGSSDGLR